MEHVPGEGAWRGFFVARELAPAVEVTVRDAAGLRTAVAAAKPGTRILMAPGTYREGFFIREPEG